MKHDKQTILSWTAIITIAILTAAVAANSQTPMGNMSVDLTPEQNEKAVKENQKIIRGNFDKISRGDAKGAAEDFSEEISNHGEKVGRKGIQMVLEDILRTFPDAKFEIKDIVANGETVIVRTHFKGTHRGKGNLPVNGGLLVGVEPTGKTFQVQHIHWFRLRDNKIIEHYAGRDDIEMMQQLGLSPQILPRRTSNLDKQNEN